MITQEAASRGWLLHVENDEIHVLDEKGKSVMSAVADDKGGWESLANELGVMQASSSFDKPSNTQEEGSLLVYTDGGSRGNPGPSASGYVIMDSEGEILEEGGEYLGVTTNNQAEYQAVKLALERAEKFSPKHIVFKIDSLLVVNQINGKYKVKNRDLWPIHDAIKALMKKYESVEFIHVRREYNKLADAKVNEVLDSRA